MFKSLNNLHHANLLIGSSETAKREVLSFFRENGISLTGSPDFFLFENEVFGIDEARALSASALRRAFTGRKIYLILPEKITLEAQNALLKTFEEPVSHTYFFLALRNEEMAIPTLRSRMNIVHLEGEAEARDAEKFLKLSAKDRLLFVKKFIEEEKNLSGFLDELLVFLKNKKAQAEEIEKVYKMRLVSDDRGASPKIILEHLSLML